MLRPERRIGRENAIAAVAACSLIDSSCAQCHVGGERQKENPGERSKKRRES